jgi:hypothetical protein
LHVKNKSLNKSEKGLLLTSLEGGRRKVKGRIKRRKEKKV